jgi:hypothetical protein
MNNEYHFTTRWRFEAPPERIFEVLAQPLEFPRWWGSVYLRAERIGDAKVRFVTKGKLPYTLRWDSEAIASRPPGYLEIRATGDFEGRGIWVLEREGSYTHVAFDWKLTAQKPLLRYFSFLLKPVFQWNHRWAMEQGKRGMERELERGAIVSRT